MLHRTQARACEARAVLADPRCAGCAVRAALERPASPAGPPDMLLRRSRMLAAAAKSVLYAPQAPADAVYAVRAGIVKLVREGNGRGARVVRWMRSGAMLGLEALAGETYRHRAVAVEPVEYCRIPLSVVRGLESPALHAALMRQWLLSLDEADGFAAVLGQGNAERRFARLLLKLGTAPDGAQCVSLLRSDLGAALGVSTETASRLMADFRRRGLVRRAPGRRLSCDSSALRALAVGS